MAASGSASNLRRRRAAYRSTAPNELLALDEALDKLAAEIAREG